MDKKTQFFWSRSHQHFRLYFFTSYSGTGVTKRLQKLTDISLNEMESYTFTSGELAHIPNALISTTGYTGESGFEIYVENKYAAHLWEAIFEAHFV